MGDSTNDIPLPIGMPIDTTELAELVTIANSSKSPLIVAGSSSKLDWGGIVRDARSIVSTQKLDRLIAHAVVELTITVEAGMKFAKLQEILATA